MEDIPTRIALFDWIKRLPEDLIDLYSSGMHNPLTISDIDISAAEYNISGNNFYGYKPLNNEIAKLHSIDPDQLVVTSGASMANFVALSLLLDRDDTVLIESPQYQPLLSTAKYLTHTNPLRLVRKQKEQYGVSLDEAWLTKHKPKITILTNPHNPTGKYDLKYVFHEYADIVSQWDGYVLVDEIFLPFHESFPRNTLAGSHQRIICTGGLTKAWGLGGLRVGWIIADAKLMRRAELLLDFMNVNQPFVTDLLAAEVLHSGLGEKLLQSARKIAAHNYTIVEDVLSSNDLLALLPPDCGISAVVRFKDGRDSKSFCHGLHTTEKVVVVPGHYFEINDGFRISFGCDEQSLSQGLSKLMSFLKQFS